MKRRRQAKRLTLRDLHDEMRVLAHSANSIAEQVALGMQRPLSNELLVMFNRLNNRLEAIEIVLMRPRVKTAGE